MSLSGIVSDAAPACLDARVAAAEALRTSGFSEPERNMTLKENAAGLLVRSSLPALRACYLCGRTGRRMEFWREDDYSDAKLVKQER